jgi:hypothetical protein
MVDPDPLEQRSRELFEDSVDRLDARTRSRLNQARQLALGELNKGRARRYWIRAPLGGLAAAALLAMVLMNNQETTVPPQEGATLTFDDFDIVADSDSFEMLNEVEFYSWLANESAGESINSG